MVASPARARKMWAEARCAAEREPDSTITIVDRDKLCSVLGRAGGRRVTGFVVKDKKVHMPPLESRQLEARFSGSITTYAVVSLFSCGTYLWRAIYSSHHVLVVFGLRTEMCKAIDAA